MTDKICIDDDATAFEEWARLVNIYDSMPTVEDAFAAGLQRGKAHGAAEEREACLKIVEQVRNDPDVIVARRAPADSVYCESRQIEARIRQRGEK